MFDVTCLDKYGNQITTLYQWDTNQTLYIEDHGFTTPPLFHFCNQNSEKALLVTSEINDGVMTVMIPNVLLTEPYTITAYVYLEQDDSGKTVEVVTIPVRQRPMPENYEYIDDPRVIRVEELAEEIRALNASISEVEATRVQAETIRVNNENTRIANEKSRVSAENTRQQYETARVEAETKREKNEQTRQDQEIVRQTNTANAIDNADKATERANVAARLCEGIVYEGCIPTIEKGAKNGVATLDEDGTIPPEQIPVITIAEIDEMFNA